MSYKRTSNKFETTYYFNTEKDMRKFASKKGVKLTRKAGGLYETDSNIVGKFFALGYRGIAAGVSAIKGLYAFTISKDKNK